MSDDGANITVFFQKTAAPVTEGELTLPGNAEKIAGIVKNHTAVKHYLTAWPYRRFFVRMCRTVNEMIQVANFESGKRMLDLLYSK